MILWIKNIFYPAQVKEVIKDVTLVRREVQQTRKMIHETMNGEDRWFLKICDAEDPEEKECPSINGIDTGKKTDVGR